MNRKTIAAVFALVLALGIAAVSQTPPGPKHHVVFQLNEARGEAWDVLTPHVNNTREALAKDGGAEVEVVFFGPGVEMLKKDNKDFEERLKKLSESGVILSACQNAMKARKVKTEDLFPFAGQVDSGIAQITRRQESGWAYVH